MLKPYPISDSIAQRLKSIVDINTRFKLDLLPELANMGFLTGPLATEPRSNGYVLSVTGHSCLHAYPNGHPPVEVSAMALGLLIGSAEQKPTRPHLATDLEMAATRELRELGLAYHNENAASHVIYPSLIGRYFVKCVREQIVGTPLNMQAMKMLYRVFGSTYSMSCPAFDWERQPSNLLLEAGYLKSAAPNKLFITSSGVDYLNKPLAVEHGKIFNLQLIA